MKTMLEERISDWTAWAIGAIGAMAGALALMGKFIAAFFQSRIAQLEKQLAEYVAFADQRAADMVEKHAECIEKHHQAEIRLAKLEAITKP